MGHCIQTIVAPLVTANLVADRWPELPRLNRDNGFALFPVDAGLIDARIMPDQSPTESADEFLLLTNGFRRWLRQLSCGGQLAYVETDYFGGTGGQGALVCRNNLEIMPPTWSESGTINQALGMIGLKGVWQADSFAAAGFTVVRSNDDLLQLIAIQAQERGSEPPDGRPRVT